MTLRGGTRVCRRMRCTLAFFGIDRRLDLTGSAIRARIENPVRDRFEFFSVGFLWAPNRISNPRSGEETSLPPPRIDCLPAGRYETAPPIELASDARFQSLKVFGDYWHDGFKSLGNLYWQLASLSRATDMALTTEPDIVIFLRPDLLYRDSFADVLARVAVAQGPQVFVPHWQPHGGLNDRFAICLGDRAVRAYGHRLDVASSFCRERHRPLHSERLVLHALRNVPVTRVHLRAARIRVDGAVKNEDYSWCGWKPALRGSVGALRRRFMPRPK